MENYTNFKNSTMILDQSAWEQQCYALTYFGVNVFQFLSTQGIEAVATIYSAQELSYQAYAPNLFGVSLTASEINDQQSYVLSSVNGSLTLKELDYSGFPVDIVPSSQYARCTTPLWDFSPYFKKLSIPDKNNIYLGRHFQKIHRNFFIFSNDRNQINQAGFEKFQYLRPDKFLKWMVLENFITSQKAVSVFGKIKKHDPRWVKKNTSFKDI